jgi:hypothetical protein
MTDFFHRLQFRLWLFASRMADLIHPGYLTAETTVGRVQRFYDLLHDTKMDEQVAPIARLQHESVQSQRRESVPEPAGPVSSKAMAEQHMQEGKDAEKAAQEIRTAFLREGRLTELTELVMELKPWQDPEDVPAHVLEQAVLVFTRAYAQRMRLLVGMYSAMT